jgi:hypothetical protein
MLNFLLRFFLYKEIYTRLLMNDVNQIRIPQNKIIAETKIRKEIDNLYQKIKRNQIYILINFYHLK